MPKNSPTIPIERGEFNVYSIRNDSSAIRLIEILDEFGIDYKFFDYRDFPPSDEQLKKIADFDGSEYPVNPRNSLFKKSWKVFNKLTEEERFDWFREHYHVLHRPVIENREGEILSIDGRPERIARDLMDIIIK